MRQRTDLLSLDGKVAIITGSATGIGLAIAETLSAHGAAVALFDVNLKGEEEAARLRAAGRQALFLSCDVTDASQVADAVGTVLATWRRIDILCNNAGVTVRKTVVDLGEKEWDFVIDVGLKGTFLLSRQVIPIMAGQGGGSIINTGSGWGLKGGDRAAAYCAVKGGIVNLTRAMAIDHGPQGIRVNSVNPGDTDTPMLRDEGVQTGDVTDEASQAAYLKECGVGRPLQRIGQPNDIANAVLYLASDLSGWVTGTALVVDGGGIA